MKKLLKQELENLKSRIKIFLKENLFLTITQKQQLFVNIDSFSEKRILELYQELFFSNEKKNELISNAFKSDEWLSEKIENFTETEIGKKELRTKVVRSKNKIK